jgi:hypothetical protein
VKGSLIKVKPGYHNLGASSYGVILKEELNIRAAACGEMFRTFHVAFPDGVYRMMAYEFEIVGAENPGAMS